MTQKNIWGLGNNMYPFYAEITFGYHKDDQWIEKQKAIVTFAEDFAEAMKKIESYYGEELISVEKLCAYEACDIIELSLDVGRGVKRELEDV